MGFFKKITRPIRKIAKKIIPKEIKPFLPYIAAFYGGPAMAGSNFMSHGIGNQFLRNAISKGLIAGATAGATDEDANILRTATLAAAPDLISGGLGNVAGRIDPNLIADSDSFVQVGDMAAKTAGALSRASEGIKGASALKTIGAQGAIDASAKLAELNQEEIDKYNDSLGGNLDRGERRAQLTAIFTRAGYEPDYVDQMLTTYGYAQGGIAGLRSGYENGGTVTITQEEYDRLRSNKMGTKESLGFATEGLGMLGKSGHSREPVPMLRFAQGGEVIEESETLMAGGPYKSGRDVQDAFNVWSGMGADDKSLFEGFLDFYKQGSWRDQIMGQADVEENTMMASGPGRFGDYDNISMLLFGKPYKELFPEEVEQMQEYLQSNMPAGAANGGIIGMALGGRVGYAGGGASYNKSERYSILAKKFNKGIPLTPDEAAELEMLEMTYADPHKMAQGGIMNRNLLNTGMDKDMRGGGFIPEGTKEKADDVPARLSKNEFVMTADAVKAAGGGSVNKGAQRMYNIMNQLEAQA